MCITHAALSVVVDLELGRASYCFHKAASGIQSLVYMACALELRDLGWRVYAVSHSYLGAIIRTALRLCCRTPPLLF